MYFKTGSSSSPDAVEWSPDAVEWSPDAVEPAPDAVELIPDAVEPVPDAVELIPDAVEPIPDAVELIPDAVEPIPDAVELIPDDCKAGPMHISLNAFLTASDRNAVWCHTEDQAKAFFEMLRRKGETWINGAQYKDDDLKRSDYGPDTCYTNTKSYCSVEWLLSKGFRIFDFDEIFIVPIADANRHVLYCGVEYHAV
jgi:hypothetical protein